MKKTFALVTIIALGTLVMGAYSKSPGPIVKGPHYDAPASPVAMGTQIIATANTKTAITRVNDTEVLCAPYGTIMIISSDGGDAVCNFAQTDDLTFGGNVGTADECDMTDGAGPDGAGACVMTFDGQPGVEIVPLYNALANAVGARTGVCTGYITSADRDGNRYPPCAVDQDCTDQDTSSNTCITANWTDNQINRREGLGCAYVHCIVSANNTVIRWRFEQ